MKIIREPKVYLVGQSEIKEEGVSMFLRDQKTCWYLAEESMLESGDREASDGELLCELAARISSFSFGEVQKTKGTHKFLKKVIERKHGAVIENAVWSFIITGISRSLAQEFTRHRIASYLMRSQRYIDESEANFIEPDIIAEDDELHELWCKSIEASHQAYVEMVQKLSEKIIKYVSLSSFEQKKLARQSARSLLPISCETMLFVTMNARSLRGFLELRANQAADMEIRKVANLLYNILVKEAPSIFEDYEKIELGDGTFELHGIF